jgi:succinyl-CoA synthetase beta subunit
MIIAKKTGKKKIKKVKKKGAAKKAVKKKPTPKLPPIQKIDDMKAYDMVKKARLPVIPFMFVKKEEDLKIALRKAGFPCVMKVSGKEIIHKTEVNGVKMNINSPEEAATAFEDLMKIKGADRVLVQKQESGLELILGAKSDPTFGHIVSLGIGGIYVEILKDVTFRIAPLTADDAEAMLKELKGYEILAGARGQKPINFKSLHDTIVRFSRFIINNKAKAIDINPLICNDRGCFITDIRMIK